MNRCLTLLILLLLPLAGAARSDGPPAFLLRPDIHGDKVVFTSEGDLWLGSISAGTATRLTTHSGVETAAHFSPDGSRIAFSAQYDGGTDVYLMPAAGGVPKRLTYDTAAARVVGWTPDGRSILYSSRHQNAEPDSRLWSVPADGGMPKLYPIPRAEYASMQADGRRIAYVPLTIQNQNWARYEGGQADDVWLTDLETHVFTRLTDYKGVDTTPVWVGEALYIISERSGLPNLYRLDPKTRQVTPATRYTDYEARYPATDGKRIVFQHGSGLALFDPANGEVKELAFTRASDRIHTLPRRVPAASWLTGASIGPTGKRVLIEARGQILSVPAEEGESRPVAPFPGSRSHDPVWSPDGKRIAFISDRSGEEQLWVVPTSGGEGPRQLTRDHKGPFFAPVWSPDGNQLAVADREMRILRVDAESGATTLVDQSDRGGSYDAAAPQFRFSPDSKWIAFTRAETNWNTRLYLYEMASGQKTPVTSREMNSYAPAFDPAGKYLFFLQDRTFDPKISGLNHSYSYDKATRVSLVTLSAETPSPFVIGDDEEGETPAAAEKKPVGGVDVLGVAGRIAEVPVPADRYRQIEALDGRILLMTAQDGGGFALSSFDLKKKKSTEVVSRLTGVEISADRKKALVMNGREISVVDTPAAPVAPGAGRVDTSGLTLTVDPVQEWSQIFNESWRLARDFFYDPAMHGIDWDAVRRKYAAQMPAVADRSDLTRIQGNMIAELVVGHAYVGGGDDQQAPRAPMGYLGADFEPAPEGGAFRIKKFFPGDGFDMGSRAPLLAPGLNLKAGDYIVAIGGEPVTTDRDIQAWLIGTAGRVLSLSVNDRPSADGARVIRVRPIASERSARYYDWVAQRREYVRTHGGENIGYLHLPDMSTGGLQEWAKHYYAQLDRDALVIDDRNNGGGWVGDTLLLQAADKPRVWFKPRYGASWTYRDWAYGGHLVALTNEHAGSDGEAFCDSWQRLKLGPIIGARTWGGLVGSGGGYSLVDGGRIFIPNYGAWSPDGKWVVEGPGFTPDIEVENDPASVMAGNDPQLDRAIAYLKDKLQKEPILHPNPPPFPNKALRAKGG